MRLPSFLPKIAAALALTAASPAAADDTRQSFQVDILEVPTSLVSQAIPPEYLDGLGHVLDAGMVEPLIRSHDALRVSAFTGSASNDGVTSPITDRLGKGAGLRDNERKAQGEAAGGSILRQGVVIFSLSRLPNPAMSRVTLVSPN
jgi:hypothetical protein